MEGLVILTVLLAFVLVIRLFDIVFIGVCRLLPMSWRVAIYNWLCTNVFIDEDEEEETC